MDVRDCAATKNTPQILVFVKSEDTSKTRNGKGAYMGVRDCAATKYCDVYSLFKV